MNKFVKRGLQTAKEDMTKKCQLSVISGGNYDEIQNAGGSKKETLTCIFCFFILRYDPTM